MAPIKPTDLYSRLMAYYTGAKVEPDVPPISTRLAILLLIVYTLLYVVPFYLSSTTRPSATLSRDAPSVIRGRLQSVIAACILCSFSTFGILSHFDKSGTASPLKVLHKLGYFPMGVVEAAKTVLLTAILFVGPLFEAGIAEGRWRGWIRLRGLDAVLHGWIGYRTIIAGPVTEEVLFRSASIPLLVLAQTPNNTIIFLTPIVFGLAHIHHFYEFRITHPHTPLISAVLRTVLQLTYTTLFGGYATFIYLRTGSLLSVILVHAFCNWMGFPRFWGKVEAGESVIGPDFGEGKREDDQAKTGELGVAWSVVYYALLVVGAVGWWKYLWPLTASEMALVSF